MMILRNLTHKPRAGRGLRMRTLLQFDWRPVEEGLQPGYSRDNEAWSPTSVFIN